MFSNHDVMLLTSFKSEDAAADACLEKRPLRGLCSSTRCHAALESGHTSIAIRKGMTTVQPLCAHVRTCSVLWNLSEDISGKVLKPSSSVSDVATS